MDTFISTNTNSSTIIKKEVFEKMMEENYRLKNEIEMYKKEKSFNEFKSSIVDQIQLLNNKIGKLENSINNVSEIKENLSTEETRRIITNDLNKTKNEIYVSKLIYSNHDCDSYEDFFRDNIPLLENKCDGIQIALDNLKNDDDSSS